MIKFNKFSLSCFIAKEFKVKKSSKVNDGSTVGWNHWLASHLSSSR